MGQSIRQVCGSGCEILLSTSDERGLVLIPAAGRHRSFRYARVRRFQPGWTNAGRSDPRSLAQACKGWGMGEGSWHIGDELEGQGALVVGARYSAPTAGWLVRVGDAFRFATKRPGDDA